MMSEDYNWRARVRTALLRSSDLLISVIIDVQFFQEKSNSYNSAVRINSFVGETLTY